MYEALKTKPVAIKKLVVPGDWKQRLADPRVANLAESIKADGPIHPPLVRKADMTIVCGVDRVAAHSLLGIDEILVTLIDADDVEVERLRIKENLERRPYTGAELNEMRNRYLELMEPAEAEGDELGDTVAANSESNDSNGLAAPKRGRGRPKTEQGKKRKAAAKKLGVSGRTIRRAGKAAKESKAEPPPKTVETHGCDVPQDYEDAWVLVKTELEAVERLLVLAQGKLTTLEKDLQLAPQAIVHRIPFQRLYQAIKKVAGDIRGELPYEACLYCKTVPAFMNTCLGCKSTGYLQKGQDEAIPSELRVTGKEAKISVAGKFKLIRELL